MVDEAARGAETRAFAQGAGRAAALAILAIPPLLTVLRPDFFPLQADEFHAAWPALQVLRGDRLYIDVFTHRPPLAVGLIAGAFAAFGASLVTLRLLFMAAVMACPPLMDALLRRAGARPWEAGAVALLVPYGLIPYWPAPSCHWFILPLALAALLTLERSLASEGEGRLDRTAFLAGLQAGAAGLIIQQEGALLCALLALRALARPGARRRLIGLASGLGSALLLAALILAGLGLLGGATRAVLLFPIQSYKGPGGFNDVDLLADLAATFRLMTARGMAAAGFHALTVAFPILAAAVLIEPLARKRSGAVFAALSFVAAVLVFTRGRMDFFHAAYLLPYVMVLAWSSVLENERSRWPRRAMAIWTGGAAALATGMWISVWQRCPPNPWEALAADRIYRRAVRGVFEGLPEGPALVLPHGSFVYFYREADAPPHDWVCPPSMSYNTAEHYAELAAWLEESGAPTVLIKRGWGLKLLEEPSPLSEHLRRRYRRAGEKAGMVILQRRP